MSVVTSANFASTYAREPEVQQDAATSAHSKAAAYILNYVQKNPGTSATDPAVQNLWKRAISFYTKVPVASLSNEN